MQFCASKHLEHARNDLAIIVPPTVSSLAAEMICIEDPKAFAVLRNNLTLVGDKWSVTILGMLSRKRVRFNELHRSVAGISHKMLASCLRDLEREGLLSRTVYPTIPPQVDYALTDLGYSLTIALEPLATWTIAHQRVIEEGRLAFDCRT